MFALAVRFDIRDEGAARMFDQLTADVVEKINKCEPGTLVYATATVEGQPLARVSTRRTPTNGTRRAM